MYCLLAQCDKSRECLINFEWKWNVIWIWYFLIRLFELFRMAWKGILYRNRFHWNCLTLCQPHIFLRKALYPLGLTSELRVITSILPFLPSWPVTTLFRIWEPLFFSKIRCKLPKNFHVVCAMIIFLPLEMQKKVVFKFYY